MGAEGGTEECDLVPVEGLEIGFGFCSCGDAAEDDASASADDFEIEGPCGAAY